MSTTQSRRRWSRGLWVPVLAVVALLASGTWLVTQQSGTGWGMGSGWDGPRMRSGSGYGEMMGDYGWSKQQDAEPVDGG